MEKNFDRAGVYAIVLPNGRAYIGETLNFQKRWSTHRAELIAGNHHNLELSKEAWRDAVFVVLEQTPWTDSHSDMKKRLQDRELFYWQLTPDPVNRNPAIVAYEHGQEYGGSAGQFAKRHATKNAQKLFAMLTEVRRWELTHSKPFGRIWQVLTRQHRPDLDGLLAILPSVPLRVVL